MKIKSYISIILAALLLSACASQENGGNTTQPEASETTVTSASPTESVTAPAETSKAPETLETIKVGLKSYEGDRLTFEYEGEEQELEVWDNVFSTMGGTDPARLVINNRYGETIPAAIKLNPEKTRVVSCELLLDQIMNTFNDNESRMLSDEDRVLKMEKLDNTRLRIYNKVRSVEADIRDMDIMYMGRYPDSFEDLTTTGYILPSGTYLAEWIGFLSEADETTRTYTFCDLMPYWHFFGTVQSVTDDRAEVLLTDGKTLCDVPTYFNDGEIKEGAEVMLTLDAESSLFGSGERFEDDYAVFHTRPETYNPSGREFESLAYAKYDKRSGDLVYTEK